MGDEAIGSVYFLRRKRERARVEYGRRDRIHPAITQCHNIIAPLLVVASPR